MNPSDSMSSTVYPSGIDTSLKSKSATDFTAGNLAFLSSLCLLFASRVAFSSLIRSHTASSWPRDAPFANDSIVDFVKYMVRASAENSASIWPLVI